MLHAGRSRLTLPLIASLAAWAAYAAPDLGAASFQAAPGCRVSGKITSGTNTLPGVTGSTLPGVTGIALPGVSVIARQGDRVVGATSTAVDGTYRVTVPTGAAHTLRAELTAFTPVERELAAATSPCEQTVDLALVLAPRPARAPATATAPGAPGARGAAPGPGGNRFSTLTVQAEASAQAGLELNPPERLVAEEVMSRLLPPGFVAEGSAQAVAINGSMASIDRGMMNERMGALGRGEIDPVTGELVAMPGFGDQGEGRGGPGGPGGRGGGRGGEGRGGGGGEGRGGPPGAGARGGGFQIAGRGAQQRLYQATANYTFGGSALDSANFQLRPGSGANQTPYTRQTFGVTLGGPVKIPGVYDGTRRTNFTLTYSGTRGDDLFDQYGTVPLAALRAGDFSSASGTLVDPDTGQPFAGNQIPIGRMDPGALSLLRFIPLPNLDGATRNFHYTAQSRSVNDSVSVRVTHNFTTPAARGGRAGGAGRAAGPGGRAGGPGGRGGAQGTTVSMNAQLQYRRNEADRLDIFPTLGGDSGGSALTVPIGVNIQHKRNTIVLNANVSRTVSRTSNRFALVEDVAGTAGIRGAATDPQAWAVPSLSFTSFTSVSDVAPSRRTDTRLALTGSWSRPFRTHTLRAGGDMRWDATDNQTDANAAGAFVFTGLYTGGIKQTGRVAGADFADFLLGLPQQASIQFGPGNVQMRGKSMSLYVQDDWRYSGALTFNLGLRYELLWPFTEASGRMVNLDAAPGFTAVSPVLSGAVGPYSGAFPVGLMNVDANNLAPRVGLAWRVAPGTVVRAGYGISFNAGSYSTIARNLVAQPPFATTNTSIGTPAAALDLSNPFVAATPTTTTNNFGVDKDYVLGRVQTWNADLAKDVGPAWNLGVSYTGTRGTSLDMLRAPNRAASGLLLADVQPFTWQTSNARSILHAGALRVQRRPVAGVGGGVTYTLARSRDNASTLGGGRTSVAQNDQDLEAEWGRSSFDRRHQLSANMNIELPFGANRPWLSGGGPWAAILENWRVALTFTWQSGAPFTPTVTGAAADIARGTNGTLRANYNGAAIGLPNPTIDQYFNTQAFTVPESGTFGTASRNMIIGPGSRLLNANFSRDLRLGGNRMLSLQLSANNLLNLVNYTGINTNVNSPSFGQITSVRPMRSMQLTLRFRF